MFAAVVFSVVSDPSLFLLQGEVSPLSGVSQDVLSHQKR